MQGGEAAQEDMAWHVHRFRGWSWLDSADACALQLLGSRLSRVMLLAIEVAVEYWLALTWSPQAQWLNEIAKTGIIQDEVR